VSELFDMMYGAAFIYFAHASPSGVRRQAE
jgi:hypothetical protein